MLYRLVNPKKQSAWQLEYERLYDREFENKIININKDEISKLTAKDALWIMHYEDQLLPEVKNTKAFVMAQANGTASNPYCYQVDEQAEREAINESLDAVLTFNNEQALAMFDWEHTPKYYAIGFPVEVPEKYKDYPKQNKIVVAGRISPDKQFYLATYLLWDLAKQFEIVFCMPKGQEKWADIYKLDRFKDRFKFKVLEHNEFLEELATASHYFSCSLGDTGSVSLTEALLCGCYPIIPRFNTLQPVYDDYVSIGYSPFCKDEVEYLIKEQPPFTWHYDWSEPKICTARLKMLLDNNNIEV